MFDARLRLVGGARTIRNRTRIHLHLGTAEALARVVLLETDELRPGEEELVQIRLESPMVAERDDLFVVRSYSPMTTVGGGRVLDPTPKRHKRMREDVLEALSVLEDGDPEDVLLHVVDEAGIEGLTAPALVERLGPASRATADSLLSRGELVELEGRYHTSEGLSSFGDRVTAVLGDHGAKSPLEWGMSAEELRGKLAKGLDRKMLDALLVRLAGDGVVSRRGDLVRLGGDDVALSREQSKLAERIESRLLAAGANVPALDDLRADVGGPEFDAIVKLLVETGRVVKVTTTLLFHPDVVDDIRTQVLKALDAEGELGVPAFKDMIGVTRKYAIPLFEFFDREGTTMRSGNVRVKGRTAR
jgi:selenocysteine-specific elongation factor